MESSKCTSNLVFEALKEETMNECLDVIAESFDVDEPVNYSLGVPKTVFRLFLQDHCDALLKYVTPDSQSLSYVVRDETTGQIIAGFINYCSIENIPANAMEQFPNLAEAFEFLNQYERNIDDPHQEEQVYLAFSGVLPEYRGQGLQSRARKTIMESARSRGYTHVVSGASSYPSYRSMSALGAVERSRLVYKEWKNSQGHVPFATAPHPHVAWCMMQLKL